MCRLQEKDALVDILVSLDAHFRKSEKKTICFRQAINNMTDYHIFSSVLFVASLFDEYSLR